MGEAENEEITWGGAAAEDGGDGFDVSGGHVGVGRGVGGGVVDKSIENGVGEWGIEGGGSGGGNDDAFGGE